MILNRLSLYNVGTFCGKHTLDLTPPDREHPILLIGGLNGVGKTTLLESIRLALYGPLLKTGARGKGSYERYLRGLISRAADETQGAAVELEFTAFQAGQEHRYWVRRSWKPAGNSLREILLVSVDGRHDQVLTANWQEYVETFLPRGIAGLFFFDGEQIEALADLDRSREVLRSALDALLGLDLVTQLSADLTVLRKRHQADQLSAAERETIAECERALATARQTEDAALRKFADARVDADRAREELRAAEDSYRDAGGVLADNRAEAESTASNAVAARKAIEEELRAVAASEAPLLLVGSLGRSLLSQARAEETAARDAMLVEVLGERDASVMRWLEASIADSATLTSIREHLEQDRAMRSPRSDVEPISGLRDSGPAALLIEHVLPDLRQRLQSLLEVHAAAATAADEAERALASIPHPEAIAPIAAVRDSVATKLSLADATLTLTEDAVVRARIDRERALAAHEKTVEGFTQAELAAADDRRIIDHVTRAQATLEQVRAAATRRQLARIAGLVLEALQMLLRKDRLITDVTIDVDTTSVQLSGSNSQPLPAGDLSAGERQLLAVALLWGLARAAGQPLPVVIDTPLGRLDRSHRDRLLERYFPHASHQVVLLSTDTEIDQTSRAQLQPYVGREYRLVFNEDTTTVVPGYFWGES